MLATTEREYVLSCFRIQIAILDGSVFCAFQVMGNLVNLTYHLYYSCGSCSMVNLTKTMQHNAVSFLTYGLMIAGMDPI